MFADENLLLTIHCNSMQQQSELLLEFPCVLRMIFTHHHYNYSSFKFRQVNNGSFQHTLFYCTSNYCVPRLVSTLSLSLYKRDIIESKDRTERESARETYRERELIVLIFSLSRFLSFIRRQHSQNITRDIDADGDEAHREENEHERGETEKEALTKTFSCLLIVLSTRVFFVYLFFSSAHVVSQC